MQIPLSQPEVTDEDRAAVLEVLKSNFLSRGPKVLEFEAAVAAATGSKYAIAVNSGTSGMHLSVKSAGVGVGDEVITTPFSFVASANCILYEGGRPVFVDIDPTSYNINPDAIEAAIKERTKAIIPVHVFGRPCAISDIQSLGESRGISILEDSCEAIGATYQGKPVGSFGQSGVFAFYPNKQVTTGEGGMVVTDDISVAEKCRSWRNQGRPDTENGLEHEAIGYNYRLSDINCALGISQLKRLSQIMAARAQVARLYCEALRDFDAVMTPRLDEPHASLSWFVYVIRLADEFGRHERNQVLSYLQEHGVACRNYFAPIHLQPYFVEHFGYRKGDFPITEFVSERTIALPFHNRLSESEVSYVAETLRDAIAALKRPQFALEAEPAA